MTTSTRNRAVTILLALVIALWIIVCLFGNEIAQGQPDPRLYINARWVSATTVSITYQAPGCVSRQPLIGRRITLDHSCSLMTELRTITTGGTPSTDWRYQPLQGDIYILERFDGSEVSIPLQPGKPIFVPLVFR